MKDQEKLCTGVLANNLAVAIAICALVSLVSCQSYVVRDQSTGKSLTLDQFIDQVPGDEVNDKDLIQQKAYRGKRVYKTIYRFIDRQGYFTSFTKDFQQWCAANGGMYVKNRDLDGDCIEEGIKPRFLGGYSVKVVTTSSYYGDMTAGHATFYFFRKQEIEALNSDQRAKENSNMQREIDLYNEKMADRRKAQRDLPLIKKTGQKVCRIVEGNGSVFVTMPTGKRMLARYNITAFTEQSSNEKIQLRIASISQILPTGSLNVERLNLDGVLVQGNTLIWDDPLLWNLCY